MVLLFQHILTPMQAAILGHLGRRTIIQLMGALAIIPLLPVTLYLPVLPDIAASLHTSLETFQFTLPLFVMTQVLVMPVIAILSDLGFRLQSLYWALWLFILGTGLCLVTDQVYVFSSGRILQAMAAATLMMIVPVLINEAFENNQVAAILSFVTAIGFIIPMVGPEFSAYLAQHASWRYLFSGMLIYAALLQLICLLLIGRPAPVKHSPAKEQWKECFRCWQQMIKDRYTLAFLICNTGVAAVCQIYVSNSDFLYLDYYQLEEQVFSYILSALYLARMAITLFNGLLLKHYHYQRTIFWSMPVLVLFTGVTCVLDTLFTGFTLFNLLMPVLLFALSGFVVTNAVAGVLQNNSYVATQAIALLFVMFSAIASIINSLLILLHDGTPKVLSFLSLLIILATWLSYLFIIPGGGRNDYNH